MVKPHALHQEVLLVRVVGGIDALTGLRQTVSQEERDGSARCAHICPKMQASTGLFSSLISQHLPEQKDSRQITQRIISCA
jgi:hypothetical protein